jgi:uncharacterized membrane protein YkoI
MPKITAKEAVSIATKYYQDVTNDYSGVTIEEVELSEDGNFWLITLGHRERKGGVMPLYEEKIAYKSFKIDAETGEVISMKIKKI